MKLTKHQRIKNLLKTLRTQQEYVEYLQAEKAQAGRYIEHLRSHVNELHEKLGKIRKATVQNDPMYEFIEVRYRISRITLRYIRDPSIIWEGLHEDLCRQSLKVVGRDYSLKNSTNLTA